MVSSVSSATSHLWSGQLGSATHSHLCDSGPEPPKCWAPKKPPPLPQFLLYNRHLWYSKGKLTATVIYNIYFFPWNLNMFSGYLDISIWKGFVCDCLRFFCFVCRMKNTSKLHRKSLRSPWGRSLSPLLTSESSAWWCKKPGLCLSSFYGSLTGVTPREKTHAFTRGKFLL